MLNSLTHDPLQNSDEPRLKVIGKHPPKRCASVSFVSPKERNDWKRNRKELEGMSALCSPKGYRREPIWHPLRMLLKVFDTFMLLPGLKGWGRKNALDIKLRELELTLKDLPKEFNGFRLLHLTDLHLDALEGLDEKIERLIQNIEVDLCVFTGDYIANVLGRTDHILPQLERILGSINSLHGHIAILGNHDPAHLVADFENMGVHVLVNETIELNANGERIFLTGVDDVNCFYTHHASKALENTPAGFSIALVHSPEMAETAADNGFSLYLCGHTHGGQVCLPGGRVVVSRLVQNKAFASGFWACEQMQGYTSPGIGVSGAPVRFFTRGEATLFRLSNN